MKRPGRNRGAIYGAKSRGQSLGLRLVIRHGGHFFLCFGFAIRRRVLPGLLRAFGAEDGGHPAGASGQPFGFAGNVALLQLRQSGDVRGREPANGFQNRGLRHMPEVTLIGGLPPRGHIQPHGLRQFRAGLVRRGARRHHVHRGS